MDAKKTYLGKVSTYFSWLDRNPELSWHEHKTTDYVVATLGEDFVWRGETGVVYALGEASATPLLFRADLDALDTPFGPRHVCGHSSHTAALMAAYQYFAAHPVTGVWLYFVFQPSEECFPSGAVFLEKEVPALQQCRAVFGFHAFPGFPLGELVLPVFAGGDYFEIKLSGHSTHVKNTSTEVIGGDALLVGAALAQAINEKTHVSFIAHVGTFEAGNAANSIAGSALLTGDVRYIEKQGQTRAKGFLKEVVDRVQRGFPRVSIDHTYHEGYPLLRSDEKLVETVSTMLPVTHSVTSYATEDFSLYSAPKVYLLVGTGNSTELHDPTFKASAALAKKICEYWIQLGEGLSELVGDTGLPSASSGL